MMDTKPILYSSTIIGASLLLAAFMMMVVSLGFLSSYQKRIADQARYECAMAWKVEVKESDNVTGTYPSEQGYKKCLTEKGL